MSDVNKEVYLAKIPAHFQVNMPSHHHWITPLSQLMKKRNEAEVGLDTPPLTSQSDAFPCTTEPPLTPHEDLMMVPKCLFPISACLAGSGCCNCVCEVSENQKQTDTTTTTTTLTVQPPPNTPTPTIQYKIEDDEDDENEEEEEEKHQQQQDELETRVKFLNYAKSLVGDLVAPNHPCWQQFKESKHSLSELNAIIPRTIDSISQLAHHQRRRQENESHASLLQRKPYLCPVYRPGDRLVVDITKPESSTTTLQHTHAHTHTNNNNNNSSSSNHNNKSSHGLKKYYRRKLAMEYLVVHLKRNRDPAAIKLQFQRKLRHQPTNTNTQETDDDDENNNQAQPDQNQDQEEEDENDEQGEKDFNELWDEAVPFLTCQEMDTIVQRVHDFLDLVDDTTTTTTSTSDLQWY